MLSKLFSSGHVQEFAKNLAIDIAKRYPPELDKQPGKRPSINRLTRILDDAVTKAQSFQDEHRLGWLGKARLGASFRWEMQELGYQKDLIDLATEALLVYVSKKPTAPRSPKT